MPTDASAASVNTDGRLQRRWEQSPAPAPSRTPPEWTASGRRISMDVKTSAAGSGDVGLEEVVSAALVLL